LGNFREENNTRAKTKKHLNDLKLKHSNENDTHEKVTKLKV